MQLSNPRAATVARAVAVALAAGLLFAGNTTTAWAVGNPDGCSLTGPSLFLQELRDLNGLPTNTAGDPPDGIGETPIGGGQTKIAGETIYYQARLIHSTAAGQCAYSGGTLCIDPPGPTGCTDVTPGGGIPLLCDDNSACDPDGVPIVLSDQLPYTVDIAHLQGDQDLCPGEVRAVAQYSNGTSFFTDAGITPINADTPICNPVQLVEVSGQVRCDEDCDGELADPDTGIPNVTVGLFDDADCNGEPDSGTPRDTMMTDGNGDYSFTGLPGMCYVVIETDPAGPKAGTLYVSKADKDTSLGGDTTATDSASNPNRIAADARIGNSTGNDFLDAGISTISGTKVCQENLPPLATMDPIQGATITVYTDPNCNQDRNDDGAVAQICASGTLNQFQECANDTDCGGGVGSCQMLVTTTDASGSYSFQVGAGCYVVVQEDLPGFSSVTTNELPATIPCFPDVFENFDYTDTVQNDIRGRVTCDKCGSGDDGDGIENATITLFTDPDCNGDRTDGVQVGVPTMSASTNCGTDRTDPACGSYEFLNLAPGCYVVEETDPGGYSSVSDSDGGNPNSIAVRLECSAGDANGRDFVDTVRLDVSGQVRCDLDGDGDLADTDPPIPGVTVNLSCVDGTDINMVTDGSGNYSYTNREPCDCTVRETNLAGYVSTNDKDGDFMSNGFDEIDCPLECVPGNITGHDFLDTRLNTITGSKRLVNDLTTCNFGAPPHAGVTIRLYTLNSGIEFNAANFPDVEAACGHAPSFSPQVTDASGNYTFDCIPSGDWRVAAGLPTAPGTTFVHVCDSDSSGSDGSVAVTLACNDGVANFVNGRETIEVPAVSSPTSASGLLLILGLAAAMLLAMRRFALRG